MKITIERKAEYTATNGYKTMVYVDHMTPDKRCRGRHKVYVRAYGRGIRKEWRYVPIERIELCTK
jgi:hypothetical protein